MLVAETIAGISHPQSHQNNLRFYFYLTDHMIIHVKVIRGIYRKSCSFESEINFVSLNVCLT